MRKIETAENIIARFPKVRETLTPEYEKAFQEYYLKNRLADTTVTKASSQMEGWMHKKIAATIKYSRENGTLEIGAGTLNQLDYEVIKVRYDIVEPNVEWVETSEYKNKIGVRYDDIAEIPLTERYDRITSCAVFEHVLDLPQVIAKSGLILADSGCLAVGIPNEGRFLWHMGWKYTTGREFRKQYGLDYGACLTNEHVNTADEIETLLKYFYRDVKVSLFGLGKDLSFYRYLECKNPNRKKCEELIVEH